MTAEACGDRPGDHAALRTHVVADRDARTVRVHLAVFVLVPGVRVRAARLKVLRPAHGRHRFNLFNH